MSTKEEWEIELEQLILKHPEQGAIHDIEHMTENERRGYHKRLVKLELKKEMESEG